jgi:hypothetical protein
VELTQKTFVDRLQRIESLVKADTGEAPDGQDIHQLGAALHEKGVECAIIVPLLEVVLEFDTLSDVTYEQESTSKHGQRFDFLLEHCFLVECKALGSNLDEHRKQIARYIQGNDEINFGLLTNGVDYQFWLQKSFIEKVSGADLRHTDAVANVLELSIAKDGVQFFLNALTIFSKSSYAQTFKTIASVAGYYASGARGRPANVHEDRKLNEVLRDRIRDAVVVTKGVYYDAVVNGELRKGDKLQYKDECVEITVELTETGTVILHKGGANVVDMMKAMSEGWEGIIVQITTRWSKEDSEFQDPMEIIKIALNKQRLFGKERYEFKKIG